MSSTTEGIPLRLLDLPEEIPLEFLWHLARDNVLHLLLLSHTYRRLRAACSHPSRCGEGPGGRVRGESLARMAVLALRREVGAGARFSLDPR